MGKPLDIVFVNANASQDIYQDLARDYSAIEQPIWAALMANHVRSRGFNPEILDCEAVGFNDDDALYHLKNMAPRVVAFSMYGQQPSASAQNMEGATRLAEKIKLTYPGIKILFFGIYPSALPEKTLKDHWFIDYVCTGEGVYTISELLQVNLDSITAIGLRSVRGLAWRAWDVERAEFSNDIVINTPAPQVSQENLEKDLPGMAWDLLPMKQYRTALWHSYSNEADRKPFAALYTSLNCPFGCTFCCISSPFGGSGFKFWSPEFTILELDKLAEMGITNIKIADEMFVMRPDHFMRLCELIIERGHKFNIWAYARVDITKPQYLETLKKAGVNWLALGIESGNKGVRGGVIKGRFDDIDIRSVVATIRNAGINVIANYIFGLPDDNYETMRETLDLALEMNTEEANFYCAQAYPGSKLHKEAIISGTQLPDRYAGYSQHSYYTQNLPTKYLSAAQVLKFRDDAWMLYHTSENYLELIKTKFGLKAYEDTVASTKIKLKRKLLGD